MQDKVQLLVIMARAKLSKDTVFFGDKESTLNALVHLLKKWTQRKKYMEEILKIVTINHNNEDY